jgi:putative YhdH/YhfP family quinone oxidoreductase
MAKNFKAMLVEEVGKDRFERRIVERSIDELPPGEVLIRVRYSSLNYKDALSASGHKGVTRRYPHTPGIDAAGIVEASDHDDFRPGDEVLVTGHDLGMNTAGGFAQFIRVPAAWVLKRPEGLSLFECMAYGTAGLTAGLSVDALRRNGIEPEAGKVVISGASGGVGTLATALLATLGYSVTVATGKADARARLLELGAAEVLDRSELDDRSGKPLLSGRWSGAVDTVGGRILATLLKSMRYGGAVACCGMAASAELQTTVYPFILRAVSLVGIDSAECPRPTREAVWARLAGPWRIEGIAGHARTCGLDELDASIADMLRGAHSGRTVVDLSR